MSERKVYALCDANCRYETLTKEEIYTAIMQAVESGQITNLDTGFITTVKTINGTPLKFFVGETSEYEALTIEQRENLFAIITNDTLKEGILAAIEELNGIVVDGNSAVPKATKLVPVVTWIKGTGSTEINLEHNSVYLVLVTNAESGEPFTNFTLPIGAADTMSGVSWPSTIGSHNIYPTRLYRGCYMYRLGEGSFYFEELLLTEETDGDRHFNGIVGEGLNIKFVKIADYPT